MTTSGLVSSTKTDELHLGGNIFEGDPFTFSPSAWDYLLNRFALRSVLDLGSGLGYSSRYIYSKGIAVVAIDGLKQNVSAAVYPTVCVDLATQPVLTKVDLVHCQEVVEHIDEAHLGNLLTSLCSGRFIVMTNALPGQGGYHHVNEQPTSYWVNHLKQRGCEVLVEDTRRIRKLAAVDGAKYLAQSGVVYVNNHF